MFFVYSVSSLFSIKSEFYLAPLFFPFVVPFIHLKVKKQVEDTSDRLVSPRALTSPLPRYSSSKLLQ